MENNFVSHKDTRTHFDSIETGKRGLCRSYPYKTSLISFRPDLAFIEGGDSMRIQVPTGEIFGTDHFSCISSGGSYLRIPLNV